MRNVFPEGEESFLEKLADGNEVLRLLAEKGFCLEGIGSNVEDWSLVKLSVVYKRNKDERVRWEAPKGALWLAPSPEALKLMLTEGGDPSLTDSFGHNALYYLAEHFGDYYRPDEMTRILLENGADPSQAIRTAMLSVRTRLETAPVLKALAEGFSKLSKPIDEELENTINVAIGFSPIYLMPFIEEMAALIKGESKLSSSELDLMAATLADDTLSIEDILSRKPAPNVNAQAGRMKFTPLMSAMYYRLYEGFYDIEAVRILLKAGADPNLQDSSGDTPLFCVWPDKKSNVEAAKLLVKYGADPTIRNDDGETPFTRIFTQEEMGPGSWELAQLYLNNGAPVDTLNEYGHTPLAECCLNQNKDHFLNMMCRILIYDGADVNFQDENGRTPLMYAAEYPHSQIVKDLLENGADTSLEDKNGNTALSIFLDGETKNPYILSMLVHKGAFVGSNDSTSGEQDTNDLLLKAIRDYDVEGVRRILAEEELWITLSEELCWHFVVNNVPEPEAGDFRAKLNRGAEILRLLHEQDEDIPVEDYKGRELSYIAAAWNRFVDGYETEPDATDELSLCRHAASPMALREIMTTDKPEEAHDDDDTNILHVLAEYWREYYDVAGMIRTAAELGADLRAKNSWSGIPFAMAVSECSVLCTRAFLDLGHTLDEVIDEDQTLRDLLNLPQYIDTAKFKEAVFSGVGNLETVMYIEVMRTILCGKGRANDDLLASVCDGDTVRLKEALARGADVNVHTQRGYTPLMIAVMHEDLALVKILLEHGADIKATDMFGNSVAALSQDKEMLQLIVENGADINKPNSEGKSPVALAADNGNYSMVKALLKNGADPEPLR